MSEPLEAAYKPSGTYAGGGRASCGYGDGRVATFYVGHDQGGDYTCTRHLAFFARQRQAEVPDEWIKLCELTDE